MSSTLEKKLSHSCLCLHIILRSDYALIYLTSSLLGGHLSFQGFALTNNAIVNKCVNV